MRRALVVGLCAGLTAASVKAAGPVCTQTDEGQLRCTIERAADCDALNDYPYARSLFCPAAFAAVQEMVSRLSTTLGAGPARGFFRYFQTPASDPQAPPDEFAQSTVACNLTPYPP